MSPGRLLSKAHHRLRAGLADALATGGRSITVETWTVLAALGEVDGLTQIELGERVDKSRHHLSRLVSRLEAEGLVGRVAVARDKRLKRVVLTADGRRLHRRLVPLVERYLRAAFAGVSAADYAGFIHCLQHIIGPPAPESEDTP